MPLLDGDTMENHFLNFYSLLSIKELVLWGKKALFYLRSSRQFERPFHFEPNSVYFTLENSFHFVYQLSILILGSFPSRIHRTTKQIFLQRRNL